MKKIPISLQRLMMSEGKSSYSIVHTESSSGWGGQERRILREVELMQAMGHKVFLIAPARSELFRRGMKKKLPLIPCSFERRYFLGDLMRLRSLFKKISPDIVATHSSRDGWVASLAAKASKVPLVIKYRHVSVRVRKGLLNQWNYQRLHRVVISTSEEILSRLKECFSFSRTHLEVVPTGINLLEFDPSVVPCDLRSELGLPTYAKIIGMISVLRSWKGHEHLIRAMKLLIENYPHLYLVIVGEGSQRESLENLVLELNLEQNVFFIGYRDRVAAILRGLDALILPSVQKEGIPQIVLQAFAAGTPVVGTNIGGVREVLNEDRGWLVEPGNPGQLAEAVIDLIKNPDRAAQKVKTALDFVRREHSEQQMVEKTLNIYHHFLPEVSVQM